MDPQYLCHHLTGIQPGEKTGFKALLCTWVSGRAVSFPEPDSMKHLTEDLGLSGSPNDRDQPLIIFTDRTEQNGSFCSPSWQGPWRRLPSEAPSGSRVLTDSFFAATSQCKEEHYLPHTLLMSPVCSSTLLRPISPLPPAPLQLLSTQMQLLLCRRLRRSLCRGLPCTLRSVKEQMTEGGVWQERSAPVAWLGQQGPPGRGGSSLHGGASGGAQGQRLPESGRYGSRKPRLCRSSCRPQLQ